MDPPPLPSEGLLAPRSCWFFGQRGLARGPMPPCPCPQLKVCEPLHRDALERGEVIPPPPPRRPANAVPRMPSAGFNGICNRQQPPQPL